MASTYKLTPLHPIDSSTYNELLSPDTIFTPKEGDDMKYIQAVMPKYDYVPPKLIGLIITDKEGYTSDNIYRAFNELYGKQGQYEFPE